jgi:hypothetical protein
LHHSEFISNFPSCSDELVVQLPESHRKNAGCLNLEQLLVFQMILGSFRSDSPEKRRFFVHGAGGTGKTYTYLALKEACEEEVQIFGNKKGIFFCRKFLL